MEDAIIQGTCTPPGDVHIQGMTDHGAPGSDIPRVILDDASQVNVDDAPQCINLDAPQCINHDTPQCINHDTPQCNHGVPQYINQDAYQIICPGTPCQDLTTSDSETSEDDQSSDADPDSCDDEDIGVVSTTMFEEFLKLPDDVHITPEMNEMAKLDSKSGLVLCHMSFILNYLLPRWLVSGPMRLTQETIRLEHEEAYVTENHMEYVFVGSFFDGMYITNYKPRNTPSDGVDDHALDMVNNGKHYSDFDILILSKIISISFNEIDTADSHPGYFTLRNPDLNSNLRGVISELKKEITESREYVADVIRCGPALTVSNAHSDFDYVPTFQFSTWSPQAADWMIRERLFGWPAQQLIYDIVTSGCHFVAKAHPSSTQHDTEWRLSFVMAEQKLVRSLTLVQRQCYIICKMLIKHILAGEMEFSSYCLKTTLLWTLEKTPSHLWNHPHTGLGAGVLAFLDNFIYFLTEHRVPMYFIPETNLIGHIPMRSIRNNLRALIHFRQNPLRVAEEFDEQYELEHTAFPSLSEIFPDVFAHAMTRQEVLADCLRLHHRSMAFNYLFYLQVHHLAAAPDAIEHMHQIETAHYIDTPIVPYLAEIYDKIHHTLTTTTGRDARDDREIADILANHAAVMSMIALVQPDDGDRGLDVQVVERVLKMTIAYNTPMPATHVYYAIFLLHNGRPDEATTHLEAALDTELPYDDQAIMWYVFGVRETLDFTLQYILQHRDLVSMINSHMLAFYLLVNTHAKCDMSKAMNMLEAFEKNCETQGYSGERGKRAYLQLAFTYMSVGDMDNAARILTMDHLAGMSKPPQLIIEQYTNAVTGGRYKTDLPPILI